MTTSKSSKTTPASQDPKPRRSRASKPKLELVKDAEPEQPAATKPKRTRAKKTKPDQPAPFNPTVSMRWEGEEKPEWTGTFDALVRMNEFDAVQDREFIEEMRTALQEHGEYMGGGGAAPVYVLKVVDGDQEQDQPKPRATKKKTARKGTTSKPKRTRAKQSAPVADSAAQTEEPTTEPKPAKKRTRRKQDAVTLAQLAERFLASLIADQRSDATVGAYKSDLAIAMRVLGSDIDITSISPHDVQHFNESDAVLLSRAGLPKALPTIERTRRVLRLALDYGEAEGLIVTTPCVS